MGIRVKIVLLIISLLSLVFIGSSFSALDAPHNSTFTYYCSNCHFSYTQTPPSWAQGGSDPSTDNTPLNRLCSTCHEGNIAPEEKTHSSYAIGSNKYGTWNFECVVCHYPHEQQQVRSYGSSAYLATGISTSVLQNQPQAGQSQLVMAGANWQTDEWQGKVLIPNVAYYNNNMFKILNNTSNTITVKGIIPTTAVGKTFAIIYGKYVRSTLNTKTTKFLTDYDSGANKSGFIQSDYTGVCQVCHTQTTYWRADGTEPTPNHNVTQACTNCHPHADGFKPSGGCDTCHGNPPIVSTLGGPDGLANSEGGTGSTSPGAHQRHATSGNLNYSCDTCHAGGMPTSPVYDKKIQIGFNALGIYQTGTYDGRTTLANGFTYQAGNAGTTITQGGTWNCSNIYCHSNVQGQTDGTGNPTVYGTPTWNNSASVQCGTCHKADGVQGNATLMDSGSHTKHVASPYSKPCSECHNGAGSGTSVHVNNNINMAFVADPHGNTGSYSQSPNTPGNGYGSCSNVYCHSMAQTNGGGALTSGTSQYKTVTWGSAVICGNCHGIPPSSGAHLKHADVSGYGFDCWVCHNNAGINKQTGIPTPKHTDRNIDISFNAGYGSSATYSQDPNPPGNGYGTCSTTYCHSNGTGGTLNPGDPRSIAANTSPIWSGTTTCGSCHGGGNATGQPNYANGTPKANSHSAHPTDCSICHYATTTDGTTITNIDNHVNRLYNLDAKTGYSFTYTYQATGGSCSSISCHSGNGATWGSSLSCGDCHAVPPATGAHVVHFGGTSAEAQYGNDGRISTATAYKFNCGNCHPLSVSMHGNGTVDIELYNASATGFKANNPATASRTGTGTNTQCSDVYCHSNGADGANRVYKTTPTWGSTFGANKCGQCHDNPPQYAGQSHYVASDFMGKEGGHLVGTHFDNIYTGTTELATTGTGPTNSHGNSTYSTTISCYICHSTVVSSSTIDTYALNNVTSSVMKCSNCHTGATPTPLQNGVIADKSLHVSATKEVALVNAFTMKSKAQLRDDSKPSMWTRNVGYKVSGAYDSSTINSADWDSGTKTCTTACHNNQPVTWGDTGVTCNSCHKEL